MAGDGTGEHPNGRKAMDDLKGRLVGSGMDPKKADTKAREAALREDRRRNK